MGICIEPRKSYIHKYDIKNFTHIIDYLAKNVAHTINLCNFIVLEL